MTVIAVVLALLIERLLSHWMPWSDPAPVRAYVAKARDFLGHTRLWRDGWIVPLLLLLPTWLTFWLFWQISNPLLTLALSTLVLLLCLGPRDLAEDVDALLQARARGDTATAALLARRLQRGPELDASSRTLTGALFIQSHERLFGVLLWFFALGPGGAVLYRIVSQLPRHLPDPAESAVARYADLLHGVLAWLPVRITALLFGLAGSLDDALKAWARLRHFPDHGWRSHTWAILAETAGGSLESEEPDGATTVSASLDETLREVLRLQWRALLILLAFFAFFATGSWMQ